MRRTATVLAATLLWTGSGAAWAAEGDPVTGYWTRTNPGLPVPVTPPTPVPDGGTWISADPSGPIALSALRAGLAEGLVAVELRLTVAEALGVPAVQACPSTDGWSPEQGGRLEGAPVADCSAPLQAKVDGEVLVVPLPAGLDAVNVLLRPAPGSAFSLTLERATAESVVTQPEPSESTAPVTVPVAPFIPSGPAFGSPVLPPAAGAVDAPLLAAPQIPPAVAPSAPAPQTAAPPVTVLSQQPRAAVAPQDRTQSLLAVAVLVLLAAQAVRLARQPAVAPRSLGGAVRARRNVEPVLAEPTRGVGRFRTARDRPPVQV